MTPADELYAAASRLRRLISKTSCPPWLTRWDGQQYELRDGGRDEDAYPIAEWTYGIATWEPDATEQRAECNTADADYMATVHPGVGKALADWLDQAADAFAGRHVPDDEPALAVARAINAGGEQR